MVMKKKKKPLGQKQYKNLIIKSFSSSSKKYSKKERHIQLMLMINNLRYLKLLKVQKVMVMVHFTQLFPQKSPCGGFQLVSTL